ncbi:MAG: hypothetical protein JWN34_913 [Bryobacterales bacterium]|nr:hypothetical protein [Bryobacterales bacterium]
MALFEDGPACAAGDLARIDAGLLDTAAAYGIDVTAKLALAHEALASDLQLWLDRAGGQRIGHVVVTDSIRQWETMQALALVYRDAYFADLGERYRVRWDEYSRLCRSAYEQFITAGLALVHNPVRKAAPPLLSIVSGPQTGGSFYASVAWVNAEGQQGEASEASSLAVPDGRIMTVSAVAKPVNAIGFNVFAGTSLGLLTQRNQVPLPASASFLFIPGSSADGPLAGSGQKPDFTRSLRRTLPRG